MPVEYKRQEEKEITYDDFLEVKARIQWIKEEADYVKNVQKSKLSDLRREMASRVAWIKRYQRLEDEEKARENARLFGENGTLRA